MLEQFVTCGDKGCFTKVMKITRAFMLTSGENLENVGAYKLISHTTPSASN